VFLAEIRKREAARQLADVERNADAIRARCKTFSGFVREAWHVLEPTTRYIHSWHIEAICQHLEAVTDRRITRLLINVPPGSMKSLLVSVLWPAWEWGPKGLRSLRYLATAFNEGPVKRDTRKSRDLILSAWYQALWPEVRLVRTGETSFANSDTGTREGVAFNSLTSQRGDRLIIDDPHSIKTAESETEREGVTRGFREGALNRLNNQAESAIVIIMQRLHEKDISGVILALKMPFVHLRLPMEYERGNPCTTPLGFVDPRQYEGELLCPERFSASTIAQMKSDTTAYAWAGQYQQRPAPREGGMFQRRWFGEPVAAAPISTNVVRAWDLAATEAGGDWTVGLRMSRAPSGIFYIEHIERLRGSALDVKKAVLNLASAANDSKRVKVRLPQDVGQAGKGQVADYARDLAGWLLDVERETGSKEVRAAPFAAQCEAGNVRLVAGPWVETFLSELETFPMGAHDDQVDAASGAFTSLVNPTTLARQVPFNLMGR